MSAHKGTRNPDYRQHEPDHGTIVLVYDNQFTFEEANESLEDVSEIIFNFGLINANILKKLKDEAAGAKKNLSSQV